MNGLTDLPERFLARIGAAPDSDRRASPWG